MTECQVCIRRHYHLSATAHFVEFPPHLPLSLREAARQLDGFSLHVLVILRRGLSCTAAARQRDCRLDRVEKAKEGVRPIC